MMHGREKSGLAVVAMKPANKAGKPAAELVEPRAGAKGNASQHGASRTLGRTHASQALERIRQVSNALPSSPEVGAVCGKAARTDLCGGRAVMRVPTATVARPCISALPSVASGDKASKRAGNAAAKCSSRSNGRTLAGRIALQARAGMRGVRILSARSGASL